MAEFKAFATGETEAQFRQVMSGLFAISSSPLLARDGVLGASGLTVRQTTTASSSVTVDAGIAIVQDTVLAGVVPLVNDTTKTLDVLSANPMGGLPRNDIVVFDSGTASIRTLVGTPAAVPTDPTVASTQFPLARLRHPASATTVASGVIDDLRVFTAMRGGAATVRDATERDAMARDSQLVFRLDTDTLEAFDGAAWRTFGQVSSSKAGKRTHWVKATVTTDASGYATVTHGAGFTPTVVQVSGGNPAAQNNVLGADNFTATTFRLRAVSGAGAPVSTSIVVNAFLGE